MTPPGPLETEIRRLIGRAGPMPVYQYMNLCLGHAEHGYYMTRDPLGRRGDFVTAPEISQMFGELIGVWCAAVWHRMGMPENIRLIELGPGRGTLMSDALRALKAMPQMRQTVLVHLVEISPVLRQTQEETLAKADVPVFWHKSLQDVPEGPCIAVANEFFDALPVHQAVKQDDGWHERVVEIGANGQLAFGIARDTIPLFDRLLPRSVREAPNGAIFEWRPDATVLELGSRVVRGNGAALIIDYGHLESAAGDTFQAVRAHDYTDPLAAPGAADVTAHVDFAALANAAESIGARVHAPVPQGEFLRRLGIETRAARLKVNASRDYNADIDVAVSRLTGGGRKGMGTLFKAMAISHPALTALPALETP